MAIRILAVGKLKTPHWLAAAEHYKKRLAHGVRLEEVLVRDAPPTLSMEERIRVEGASLLKQVRPADVLVCLDERGSSLDSVDFARWLGTLLDTGKTPCFAVGGAYGLSDEVRARAARILSFGPMTLPHELARVLLLEQLYRAMSIRAGTGYHH